MSAVLAGDPGADPTPPEAPTDAAIETGDVGAAAASPAPEAGGSLRLDGELSIFRALELKRRMLDAVAASTPDSPPRFDLSEVTEIDTAGVQLLLLARREAADGGLALDLADASDAVRSAFSLLRLDDHLAAAADVPAAASRPCTPTPIAP